MELNPLLKEKNSTDLLSLKQIDSAWPLLDVLPLPVTVTDTNYMVVRANQEAVHEYSHID